MLLGQYDCKIDEKARVAFPKKFREDLGEKLIITKGIDKNLIIVSVQNWESLLEGTEELPFLNKDVREIQRFLLGNASFLELDEKGRFLIPSYLRDYADLRTDAIFIGVKRFVEVWGKAQWEEEQRRLSEVIPSVTSRLSEKRGEKDE